MRFVVIESTPGYMPEDCEPYTTSDYAEAVRTMREDIERYTESLADACIPYRIEEGIASADNLAAAIVYLEDTVAPDLGRCFQVVRDYDAEEADEIWADAYGETRD